MTLTVEQPANLDHCVRIMAAPAHAHSHVNYGDSSLHAVTPLVESAALSRWLGGVPVYLKLDNAQPSGSFKIRGIGALCSELVSAGAKHLVSSSGGNAGMAVAYSARRLGVAATVVVPHTTSHLMRNRLEQEGAHVIVHGDAWDEAHTRALSLAAELGTRVVHPFDDARIWRGHATLVEELRTQLPALTRGAHLVPTHILVAVGGGGLLCGVLQGLHALGEEDTWTHVRVVACETKGADSYAQALAQGVPVTLPAITSIATTLGARRVSDEALAWSKRHLSLESRVVSDAMAVRALELVLLEHRILVEPACASAFAPLLFEHSDTLSSEEERVQGALRLSAEERAKACIVVVVCGGNGVSLELLRDWKEKLGLPH